MMRNKRTEARGHADLAPVTEHILSQLGHRGAAIRKRLKLLYGKGAVSKTPEQDNKDKTLLEGRR